MRALFLFPLFGCIFFFQAKASSNLVLSSYNLALAHAYVPYAKERLPFIVELLKKSDADVLCLQEAWSKKDRKKIIKGLRDKFPHIMYSKIENKKSERRPTCRRKELFGEGKFVDCMQKQCKDLSDDEFTDCILNKCGRSLEDLKNSNRECATSLMAQVGKSALRGIMTVLNPFKRAGLFTYKGSDGLLLLSKIPFKRGSFVDLSEISTLTRRSALSVDIDVNGVDYNLLCTHLTANLDDSIPYTGKFSSWSKENEAQVISLINSTAQKMGPVVLMGDFNCSPSIPGKDISGSFTESCKLIKQADFIDPVIEVNPECSFCASNTHNNRTKTKNFLIDHIFLRNLSFVSSKIIYKEKIVIVKNKKRVLTNISDHYGVRVELERP